MGDSSDTSLSNGTLSNIGATEIPAVWCGDTVHVSVLPADANQGGNINALDLTTIELDDCRADLTSVSYLIELLLIKAYGHRALVRLGTLAANVRGIEVNTMMARVSQAH